MSLTSERFAALVERARLAPSVHNTQPTRWRLLPDGTVLVLEATDRRLPVGDPAGRDAAASHGAAIEGFAIASAAFGLSVRVEPASVPGPDAALRPVARLTLLAEACSPDPLAPYVDTRRTFRGAFAKNTPPAKLEPLTEFADITLVRARDGRARIAALNDRAGLRTYRDAAYRAELRQWMRLSRRDPRWPLDGLNAQSLEMSPLVAGVASVAIAPRVFEALDRLRLGAPLVSEAAIVRSSDAVALFHRPLGEEPLATGRRWYRLCLEVERLGLSAAPLSAVADDSETRALLCSEFGIGADRRLINAFRIGVPPRDAHPRARLSSQTFTV